MSNEPQDLNLIVTPERLEDVDLETFYYIEASPRAAIDFVAHFVADDEGHYLPKEDAIKAVLVGRKIGDIKDIAAQLEEKMESAAVPKE